MIISAVKLNFLKCKSIDSLINERKTDDVVSNLGVLLGFGHAKMEGDDPSWT